MGGREGNRSALGRVIGPAVAASDVPEAIARLLHTYVRLRNEGEIFIDTLDRTGLAPFKAALYREQESTHALD